MNELKLNKHRFCFLYVPLGMKEEGIIRYCNYLRLLVGAEGESINKQLAYSLGRGLTVVKIQRDRERKKERERKRDFQ